MLHRFPSTLWLVALATLLGNGPVSGQAFRVDPDASTLAVKVYRAGIARALGHDHVVRATRFSGQVRFTQQRVQDSGVTLEVDARSLRADEPEMRQRFEARGAPLSAQERQEIQQTMEGPDQLDVERYPRIRFESTALQPLGDNRFQVTGNLTLHGTTRSVRFPATVELRGGALRATGSFDFRQSDFGIEPFRAALGSVRNRDTVTLHFDLLARP